MRRALMCAAAIVLAAAVGTMTAPVRAAGCPALDYQAGLASARAALLQAPPDVPGVRRELTALAATDGAAPALQPVLTDLSATPPHVADAIQRLTSMSATLAYPHGSVCNENAGAARNALRGVYGSPDFGHLDDSSQRGWLSSIANFIAGLFGGAAGALGPVGTLLLALALVGIGLLWAWHRWRGSAALRGAAVDEPATPGDDPDVEWRAADRAGVAGAYREAVRRAFRSALLDVALRSRVRIDTAWTTRELLQGIDAGGDVLAALAAAAALFDRAWYSGGPVTCDDWALAQERCATVRRLARSAGAMVR